MSVTLAVGCRAIMLDGLDTFLGTGSGTATATLYQTNTALAVFNLANTPFGSGSSDSLALASVPIANTGTAVGGYGNRMILRNRDAATGFSFTVSGVGGGGDVEVPSILVTAAAAQSLNYLVLRMGATGLLRVEASLTLV